MNKEYLIDCLSGFMEKGSTFSFSPSTGILEIEKTKNGVKVMATPHGEYTWEGTASSAEELFDMIKSGLEKLNEGENTLDTIISHMHED